VENLYNTICYGQVIRAATVLGVERTKISEISVSLTLTVIFTLVVN
jgi:hypothetical protein